jgi:hypothetical protein
MSDEQQDLSLDSNSPTSLRARRQGQRMSAKERKVVQDKFLTFFREEANVTAACVAARIDRNTVYDWKSRYPDFAKSFEEAEAVVNDAIDSEIYRRGVKGWFEPAVSAGKWVQDENGEYVMIPRYSDAMLTLLAKSRMKKYREKQPDVDLTVQINTMAENAKDELLTDLAAAMENENKEPSNQE